jgi:outer membrane protein OmpA-like peptidoglycan-associated protein
LVGQIKAQQGSGAWKVDGITLTGHADISNGTGNPAYNVKLAQDRADTVKQFLVAQGLAAELVTVSAKADTEQVVQCDRKVLSRAALEQCLLPNRRVQLQLQGWVTGSP